MKTKFLILMLIVLFASGCASSKMIDSTTQELVAPSADKAQIVFIRSSFVGSAIQASIFDVTSSDAQFIGILSNAKKLSHSIDPGEHTFMVTSEAADFMKANLIGGKTYYAIVTPRMGAWKARFSMLPVRRGTAGDFQYESDRFQGFLKGTKFSENTPASNAWYEENRENIATRQDEYWAVWQQKSEADQKERTLNPDDGV